MTRNEALEIARINREAHLIAQIETAFRRAPEFDELTKYGYFHGWYGVGEFNFRDDEVSGQPYDATQGGWAFL